MATTPPDLLQRLRATCDDGHNLLLQAGAGSGKTRTLLDRLAWLLATKDASLTRLVAITFTEKAAGELKARLRELCRDRVAAGDDGEGEAWRRHLRSIDTAHIGTIHGFCARLLRVHALRLGLDPLFEVLDETQGTLLLRETMQQFAIEGLRAGSGDLARLTVAFGLGGVVRALVYAAEHRGEFRTDQLPSATEDVLAAWEAALRAEEEALLRRLREASGVVAAAETLRSTPPREPTDKLAVLRGEVLVLLDQALDASVARSDALAAWGGLAQLRKPGSLGAQTSWPGDGKARTVEAIRVLQGAAAQVGSLAPADPRIVPSAAELTAAFSRVLPGALDAYAAAKAERSALDFDDLLLLTRELLRDHPDVRRDEQERFEHILVDEFQDTDPIQRDIIWYVAQEGTGTRRGGDPKLAPGKLFVVGDPKQSIYRFRGADVTVYNNTRDDFEGEERPECATLSLSANFRSQKRLVAFLNDLFSRPEVMGCHGDRPAHEAHYSPLEATRGAPPDGVDVTFLLAVAEEAHLEALRERAAAQIAAFIEDGVRSGKVTAAREQDGGEVWEPARWSDFMVLLPTMTSVHLYERALRRRRIPYYVVSGRGFYNRPEIVDVVSVLRVLDEPQDEVSLARVLRSPFCAVSDEGLYWLARGNGLASGLEGLAAGRGVSGPLGNLADDDRERATEAAALLQRLREARHHLPLPDLIERILDETGLPAIAAARFDGPRACANLRKLVDVARSFEARGPAPLSRFIEYVETLRTQEVREAEAPADEEQGDTVVLMTIHKAKGLQRPVVVVADLWRGGDRPDTTPVVLHEKAGPVLKGEAQDGSTAFPPIARALVAEDKAREEAERRRLLYVAFTRAQDRLVVSTPLALTKDGVSRKGGVHADALLGAFGDALLEQSELRGSYGPDEWCAEIVREAPARPDRDAFGEAPLLKRHTQPIALGKPLPLGDEAEERAILRRVAPQEPELAAISRFTVTELAVYLACPRQYRLRYVEQLAAFRPASETPGPGRLNPLERGTVVHRALERLGRGPVSNLRAEVEGALRECGLAGHAPEDAERILAGFVRFTGSSTWELVRTAAELRTEAPIVARVEGGLVEGQIDALVRDREGELHLIDYKTGRAQDEGTLEQHRFQIGAYAAALESAKGRLPATLVVHYFDRNHAEPVPPREGADTARRQAAAAMAGIRAGEFPRAPDCGREGCRYAWVCGEDS